MVYKLFLRNRLLGWTGTLFFVWSMVLLLLLPGFEKEVLGINAMVKPLKFALSLCLFSWTMAWYSPLFKDPVYVRRMSILVAITSVFEQSVIHWQASRGRMSHFNQQTPLDGILFALMGIMIVWMTVAIAMGAFKLRQQSDALSRPYKRAVYNGIWIFVVAAMVGGVMSALNTHVVGAAMGGKGLPFLNWSFEGGDLRIAHFVGMHALQLLPWLACKLQVRMSAAVALTRIQQFSFIYLFLVLFAFIHAVFGKSIFPKQSEAQTAENVYSFDLIP